jgi:Rod binding domain-containing protein
VNVDNAAIRNLMGQSVATGVEKRQDPKVERSAHEFEASLMAELLKPLQEGDGLTGESSDGGQGSGGALGDFASESLARAISERGGFGIADRILHQFESEKGGRGSQKSSASSELKFSGQRSI